MSRFASFTLTLDAVKPRRQTLPLDTIKAIAHGAPQFFQPVLRVGMRLEQQRHTAIVLGKMANLLQYFGQGK